MERAKYLNFDKGAAYQIIECIYRQNDLLPVCRAKKYIPNIIVLMMKKGQIIYQCHWTEQTEDLEAFYMKQFEDEGITVSINRVYCRKVI